LYDENYIYTTLTSTTSSTTARSGEVDLSIIAGIDKAGLQSCITSKCISEALACNGNDECKSKGGRLVTESNLSDEDMAALCWNLGAAAETNTAARDILMCTDTNCGTNIGALTFNKGATIATTATTATAGATIPATTTPSLSTSTITRNVGDGETDHANGLLSWFAAYALVVCRVFLS